MQDSGWPECVLATDPLGKLFAGNMKIGQLCDAMFGARQCQRNIGVEQSKVVCQLIGIAGQEDSKIEGNTPWLQAVYVSHDVARAIVSDCVVVLWFAGQFVGAFHHVHEQCLRLHLRSLRGVKIDIDGAMPCSPANQVSLGSNHVHKFVLS